MALIFLPMLVVSPYVPAVTWNPNDQDGLEFTNGNLTVGVVSDTGNGHTRATLGRSSGKYYFEVVCDIRSTASGGQWPYAGTRPSGSYGSIYYYLITATGYTNGGGGPYAVWSATDIFGVAVDMTAGKLWIAKNNSWVNSGNPAAGTSPLYTGLSGTHYPSVDCTDIAQVTGRFKASAFSYSPPSGFLPWQS